MNENTWKSPAEEESIFKRSIVLTGKLVGVFTLWVALLSFVVVTITSHAVGSLLGAAAGSNAADTTRADTPLRNVSLPSSAKPNG
jgi:hypothetical protein